MIDPPKSAWGPGPWQDEPDEANWRYLDQFCFMLRGPYGSWNGYVAVPPGHPFWGKRHSDCIFSCESKIVELPDENGPFASARKLYESGLFDRIMFDCHHSIDQFIRVHGGVTWASYANEVIQHPDADPFSWCVGFDTGHAWDIAPGMIAHLKDLHLRHPRLGPYDDFLELGDSVYRDFAYVTKEVNNLAEQVVGFGLPLHKLKKVQDAP